MQSTQVIIVVPKSRANSSVRTCVACLVVAWLSVDGARRASAGQVCDPNVEICFQGIGDLPGGFVFSQAWGIARVNGVIVVVGESSSTQSVTSPAGGGVEACKFSGGEIRRIINAHLAAILEAWYEHCG